MSMTVPFYEELKNSGHRDQLKAVYLAPWREYLPLKDLEAIFEQALPLGLICGILGHAKQLSQATSSWEKAQEQANLMYYLKYLIQVMS